MLKLLGIFFISCLVLGCGRAGGDGYVWPKTDVGKSRLFGAVKSVDETEYAINDDRSKDKIFRHVDRFNKEGYIVELIDTSFISATVDRVISKYSDPGKVVEEDRYWGDTLLSRSVYSNSADGMLARCIKYKNDTVVSRTTNVFDSKGNLIVDSFFNGRDTLLRIEQERHDDSGNIVSDSNFDGNNVLIDATTHKYDRWGNEIEFIIFNAERHTRIITQKSYDKFGNVIDEQNYFKNKLADASTSKYKNVDKYGNWLVKERYSAGKLEYVTIRVIEYW